MKHALITLSVLATLTCTNVFAQQVVDSPVKQVVITTPAGFAATIDEVDRYLANNQEEEAFKAYNAAMEMLGQNIADYKNKIRSAASDGERLMYTEKFNAQSKHYGKLKELSLHLARNRNLVNLEFKDALKNM